MFTSKSSRNRLEVSGWCSYECIAGKDLEDLTFRFIFLSPGALEEPVQVGSARQRAERCLHHLEHHITLIPKSSSSLLSSLPRCSFRNVIFHSVILFSNHHLSKSKSVLNDLGRNFQLCTIFCPSLPEKSPPFSGVIWALLPWAVMVLLTFWQEQNRHHKHEMLPSCWRRRAWPASIWGRAWSGPQGEVSLRLLLLLYTEDLHQQMCWVTD